MAATVGAKADGEFIDLTSILLDNEGIAIGVSSDGNVVVGNISDSFNATVSASIKQQSIFHWRYGDEIARFLDTLPGGNNARVGAVSADGNVVVGDSAHGGSNKCDDVLRTFYGACLHAFRWTADNSRITDLGALTSDTYSTSKTTAVSADGDVVVGESNIEGHKNRHAFRWTASDNAMRDLGTLPGTSNSLATGISADGGVVVGDSDGDTIFRAFRWTASDNTMRDLGALPGGTTSSAVAVSADGNVVIGSSGNDGWRHVFRWTASDNTMHDLSTTLAGKEMCNHGVHAVSPDGNVVIGGFFCEATYEYQLFRWTADGGMQPFIDWLNNAGVTFPAEVRPDSIIVTDISADGSVMVGSGQYLDTREYFPWYIRVFDDNNPDNPSP
jgi:probable HAF family extracellular repeat protein